MTLAELFLAEYDDNPSAAKPDIERSSRTTSSRVIKMPGSKGSTSDKRGSKDFSYSGSKESTSDNCKIMTCSDAEELIRTEQLVPLKEDSGQEDSSRGRKLRILAMHGAKSNDEVTRLQLENLGITDADYDIVYLKGSVEVEDGDPDIEAFIRGPYYSWFGDSKEASVNRRSIISGVRDIINTAKQFGPFDGVYGFSSGAAMAVLASCITADPSLRANIQAIEDEEKTKSTASTVVRKFSTKINMDRRATGTGRMSMKNPNPNPAPKRNTVAFPIRFPISVLGNLLGAKTGSDGDGSVETGDVLPPFKFAILACSATPFASINELRRQAGLTVAQRLECNSYYLPSFHIIGIEDHFKAQSEEVASLFANRKVMYIPGGHGTCSHAIR